MATIATITYLAAITCGLALVGLLWREAEHADEETKTLMLRRIADCAGVPRLPGYCGPQAVL
jgi:hypothetical protein